MISHLSHPYISKALQGLQLLDANMRPRYWACVWRTMFGGSLKDNTIRKKLRAIDALYLHADAIFPTEMKDALDDALNDLDSDRLETILESWFVSLINTPGTTHANNARWKVGRDFVTSMVTWIAKSDANDTLRKIESRLIQLSLLYGQLHVEKRRNVQGIRALPASVVQALYELLDPNSSNNPFVRKATRWKIYVPFILMLHQGLRRGEALILPANSVKNAFDKRLNARRFWMNVDGVSDEDDLLDSRHSKPYLKNHNSRRQIPMSEFTARIVDTYASNFRGRPNHSFLLNSQWNRPLSHERLTQAFAQVSKCLPENVLKELKDRTGQDSISPHDLRHTCATIKLNQLLEMGFPMEEALQMMRAFFGWSRESSMPLHYAKAVFEDRLASVWNNAFDARVTLLRSLPPGY